MTRGQHQTILLKFQAVYKTRTSSVYIVSQVCEYVYQSISKVCTFTPPPPTHTHTHTDKRKERKVRNPAMV